MKNLIILSLLISLYFSCSKLTDNDIIEEDYTLVLSSNTINTRSNIDENKISDLNIFIINSDIIEKHIYIGRREIKYNNNQVVCPIRLIAGINYEIRVCANLGYKLNIMDIEDLNQYRFYVSHPKEYLGGLPMAGKYKLISNKNNKTIKLELERLLAKISIQIDRSNLDQSIKLKIKGLSIKQSPKSIYLFNESKAINNADIFPYGYNVTNDDIPKLNLINNQGISKSVNLYMLENCFGDLLLDKYANEDKVLDKYEVKAKLASYIEIKAEYYSNEYYTKADEYLIYRFYLGENSKNFDVFRNSHYNITVKFIGNGLRLDNWKIDKRALKKTN